MKTVMESVYSRFSGSALDAAIGGRLFPIQAPVGTLFPYATVSVISETNTYGFNEKYISALIEISVCSTNVTEMHDLSELAFTLFDDCDLSGLVGYDQVGPFERDFSQPLIADDVFRYIIEYRLNLQKK